MRLKNLKQRDELTWDQRMALDCGPHPCPDRRAIKTLEEMRRLWELHRDELMAANPHPTTRPWAFWAFDVGFIPDDQIIGLIELGELTEADVAKLRAMPGRTYWGPKREEAWRARLSREANDA